MIDSSAQLWARPDFQSLAFGRHGEVLAAKIRLGVMALVAAIPLMSVLRKSPGPEAWIGLGGAVSVLVLGTFVLRVAQRPKPPAWLSLVTSLLDVSAVSCINAGFVLAGNPLAATNSRVVFCCYFVALALVCLRQNPRWCLLAAFTAMVQYGGIVLWAASHYDLRGPAFKLSGYGRFNWDNHVARLILLAVTGAIGAVIVAQSRRYWRAVVGYLDAFPLGVLITGADGRSQYANQAAQNLLGRAIPAGVDVSELDAQSFLADTDHQYPPEKSAIARALAGESTECDDLEIQRPGSRIAVAAWGTPILDAGGRVSRAIAVFDDQTRRRRAEAELTRQRQYLEALHATTLALMNRLELSDLLQALVTRATELLQTPNGFLYLESADGSALDCRVWIGNKPRDPVAAPNEGAVGHVWQSGAPLVVADYDAWPGRSPQVPRGVFGPMAAVPLRLGGRVAGALGVAHEAGSKRSFREAEERLLSGFAQLASLALDNARLYASAQESEERNRSLVEGSLGLLCTHDLDGVVRMVNAAAAQSLGYAADEMVGRNLRELLPPAVVPLFDGYIDRVRSDGTAEGVMRISAKSGEERLWRYRNILRQEAGREPYVIGFALDETDRVRAQKALRRSEEQAEQLRQDLTHTMVHDLRGPLTWVMGSLDLLKATLDRGPSAQNLELMSTARRGGERILRLVESILDVARLEQGALPLKRQSVEMGTIVSEAVDLASSLAAEKRLSVTHETLPDTPAAWADPQLIARVVQNLLGNAIKFTPAGGRVWVHTDCDSSSVRVRVCDSGPGIAEDVRPRLFQKFATSRERWSGSGLGLAFCRLAVEAHGGKIWAENATGGGAQLVFTVPVAP